MQGINTKKDADPWAGFLHIERSFSYQQSRYDEKNKKEFNLMKYSDGGGVTSQYDMVRRQ